MSKKLYALLVGIDDYPGEAIDLRGCVNDVNHLYDYLKENFKSNVIIETLKNSDATRANIINLFRKHLGKAGENDVVLFHYSGHGSREKSAPEFKEYYPSGQGLRKLKSKNEKVKMEVVHFVQFLNACGEKKKRLPIF